MLDNVGREGHTYYKYIVDNYDNLKDYTCFLQGNPFDHSPNIIDNLHRCIEDLNTMSFNIINTMPRPVLDNPNLDWHNLLKVACLYIHDLFWV